MGPQPDLERGRVVMPLRGNEKMVAAVAFGPDGQTLATGSHDQTLRLWEVATGQEIAVLRGHEQLVMAVAYSPDGRRVAVAGGNAVRLWDTETGAEAFTLPLLPVDVAVLSIAFSPDGQTIAAADINGMVVTWTAPAVTE